jgi:endonuclease-3 related protein
MDDHQRQLQRIFALLKAHFGPQHWWPADTPFEVAIGAILTQNTAWTNVEKAIANLRAAGALTAAALAALTPETVQALIRPAGFFRQKGARLQSLAVLVARDCAGDIGHLCAGPLDTARRRLLAQPGIGPETADSILLYAAHRPTFVVDAYTRRICSRLGVLDARAGYDAVRALFMQALPADAALFNEYHALLVTLAKQHCRKRQPDCPGCPLRSSCRFAEQGQRSPVDPSRNFGTIAGRR